MPYIGNTIRAADDYRLIDDISSGFNGSETSFALQVAGSAPVPFPKSPQQVLISVNGVIQEPDPTGGSGFNLVGTNIVFSSAPTNGHAFFGIIYATADYLNAGGTNPAGSSGAPSITFIGDEDTGLYRKGSGSVGFVSNATEIANFDSNGITISSGNLIIPDSIIHNGDPNCKIRFSNTDEISFETGGVQRLKLDGGEVVFNDASQSVDFRVEGGTKTNLLFVDASADKIGINTASPSQRLHYSDASGDTIFEMQRSDSNTTGGVGTISFTASDGHSVGSIGMIGDGDNEGGHIIFRTTSAAANNSPFNAATPERLRISADGHVLPGTDSTYDIGTTSNRFANGYFDTLYGNGANLTGVNETTINNNIANRVILASGTADTIAGAANLTFDGTNLKVGNTATLSDYNQTDILLGSHTGHSGMTILSGTSSGGFIMFSDNNGGGTNAYRGQIEYAHSTDSFRFLVAATERLSINTDGDLLPGVDNAQDLGSSSKRWQNLFTTDLKLSNEGSQNDVDSTWGNYTIQEGYEDLFLINHRTGKKFKFNLTEVA